MRTEPIWQLIVGLALGWATIVVGVAVVGATLLVEIRGWDRVEGIWFGIAVSSGAIFLTALAALALCSSERLGPDRRRR